MLQSNSLQDDDVEVPYLRAGLVDWQGVVVDELPTMWMSPNEVSKFSVQPGDLLVAEGGDAGRATLLGEVPDGTTIQNSLHRIRAPDRPLRFLYYVLSVIHSSGWLESVCNKATIGHLTGEKLRSLPVPDAPVEDQLRISAFLDRETARLDSLMTRKRQMQALLVQRRVSLVQAALEPRGAWLTCRLKFLVGRATSGNRDHSFTTIDDGVPCLRGINIGPGRILTSNLERMSRRDHERHAATMLRAGDLLIVRSGDAGVAAEVPPELDDSNCVDLVVVRQSPKVLPKLVEYLVNGADARQQVERRRAAAALGHFNAEDVGELMVSVPHSRGAQHELVDRLNEQTSRLDALLTLLDRQSSMIAEHRRALVTAVVTGQIDVSGEAA